MPREESDAAIARHRGRAPRTGSSQCGWRRSGCAAARAHTATVGDVVRAAGGRPCRRSYQCGHSQGTARGERYFATRYHRDDQSRRRAGDDVSRRGVSGRVAARVRDRYRHGGIAACATALLSRGATDRGNDRCCRPLPFARWARGWLSARRTDLQRSGGRRPRRPRSWVRAPGGRASGVDAGWSNRLHRPEGRAGLDECRRLVA